MARVLVERRLRDVGARLKRLREELVVTDEQLIQLADEADDARIRSLVSETPSSTREHSEAEGHADAMRRHRQAVAEEIASLERTQDELLDRFQAGRA
jgi:predicted  nucleic acid-binding Zn-ribbon protein